MAASRPTAPRAAGASGPAALGPPLRGGRWGQNGSEEDKSDTRLRGLGCERAQDNEKQGQ
eukprot:1867093-Pyramimonas_sp.AAC.1